MSAAMQLPPEPQKPNLKNIFNTANSVQYEAAGFGVRAVALIIDTIFVSIFQNILTKVATPFVPQETAWILAIGLSIATVIGYWVLPTQMYGMTIGKKLMGLKVISMKGKEIDFGQALYRESLGRFCSAILLGAGYISAHYHPQKQAWHDRMAKTRVVRNK